MRIEAKQCSDCRKGAQEGYTMGMACYHVICMAFLLFVQGLHAIPGDEELALFFADDGNISAPFDKANG